MKIQTLLFRGVGLPVATALILSSCTNLKKATTYLDKNRVEAAKYCLDRFPLIEKTDTLFVRDSADYDSVINDLLQYSDSLLVELSKKPSYERIDIDSLRKVLAIQIREKVKPCIDNIKVVEKTVIDTRQLEIANGVIGDLEKSLKGRDATISERDKTITSLQEDYSSVKKQRNWLIIALILSALWITKRLWLPLVNKLQYVTKLLK